MKKPVQIELQNMKASRSTRAKIRRHISGLEDRFGRIIACRVAVRGPGLHHRTGGQYSVNIQLTLPNGRNVNVDRTPRSDERFADLDFALNDAFKRARRILQDQVRRLRGQVKTHASQPIGRVCKLAKDFGFIKASDGREIYFHRNSVLNRAFKRLKVGTTVVFSEAVGEKGPQASSVRATEKRRLRA